MVIPAIPTMYNGTRFRSRLEARWAVLFDSLKWPWLYEPVDLEFYIPDFILPFHAGSIAVEVKPEVTLEQLKTYAQRMVLAGWEDGLLVLGASVFERSTIGVIGEPLSDLGLSGEVALGRGIAFRCPNCGEASLNCEEHSWRCRVNGCYGGASHVGHLEPRELDRMWAEAGNRVQWRAA